MGIDTIAHKNYLENTLSLIRIVTMVKSAPHKVKPTKVAKTAKETKDAKKEAQPKVKKQKGYTRRAVKHAEPKINENPKSAMFIRSTTTSQFVLNVMRDLVFVLYPCLICIVAF